MMHQPLDSNSKKNPLHELVEEHISRRRAKIRFDRNYFESALQKTGKTPIEIQDIIIEMDIDADLELQTGMDVGKLKLRLTTGIIAGVLVVILISVFISGIMRPGVLFILPFILILGWLITARKAYVELGLIKKRKESRILKYENWN